MYPRRTRVVYNAPSCPLPRQSPPATTDTVTTTLTTPLTTANTNTNVKASKTSIGALLDLKRETTRDVDVVVIDDDNNDDEGGNNHHTSSFAAVDAEQHAAAPPEGGTDVEQTRALSSGVPATSVETEPVLFRTVFSSPPAARPPLSSSSSSDDEIEFDAHLRRLAKPAKTAEELKLGPEQFDAYYKVVHEKKSVFITGGAGTGKTHLLRAIIDNLDEMTTYVTASTGIAALNIGGTTVHSFAGCGLVQRNRGGKEVLAAIRRSKSTVSTWQRCATLIIDEVSMLDAHLLDVLDYVARRIRNKPVEPFGGIQLVFSGDFLQLPPVIKRGEMTTGPVFCFESETWMKIDPVICCLSVPYRQKNKRFYELLNDMRMGYVSTRNAQYLMSLNTPAHVHGTEQHPIIITRQTAPPEKRQRLDETNAVDIWGMPHGQEEGQPQLPTPSQAPATSSVKVESAGALAAEQGSSAEPVPYTTFDGYSILRSRLAEVEQENLRYYMELTTPQYFYRLITTTGAADVNGRALPEVVHLRKYCRVMLTRNFGSTDTELANGSVGTVVDFIPCRTAFNPKSTAIKPSDMRAVCVGVPTDNELVHMLLPVVQFEVRKPDGTTVLREVAVELQEWTQKRGSEVTRRQVQIPLILAYALTIHKSQGMSLANADIDFSKIFESGQAYVALSRCTNLKGTRIHGFHPGVVSTNTVCLSYYKAIELQRQRAAWLEANQAHQLGITPAVRERSYSNATTQMEDLRAQLCLLLDMAQDVKTLVTKTVRSILDERPTRLVMDVSAFYDLATSTAYTVLAEAIARHVIRVPAVVRQTIQEAAEVMSSPSSPDDEDYGGATLSDSQTIARIQSLLTTAQGDFSCEYQGPGESLALPPPLPEWGSFAPVLPLLKSEDTRHEQHSVIREVDFLLNRDPREVQQHRPILEYAYYLHKKAPDGTRSDVAVCTDSSSLAATALALGLHVVHIDARLYKADT